MKYLICIMFLLNSCQSECEYSVGNICVISKLKSHYLPEESVERVDSALQDMFPEYRDYIRNNKLNIHFEPYYSGDILGLFYNSTMEIYILYYSECMSSLVLIHEMLHLVDCFMPPKGCKMNHGNDLFFSSNGLEFTLHSELFGCKIKEQERERVEFNRIIYFNERHQ